MEVYHGGNFWGYEEGLKPLKEHSLDREFVWEGLHGKIVALYTGEDGAVLDLCIRANVADIEKYLQKWTCAEREEIETQEEFEEMERDNPLWTDFSAELFLNGCALSRGSMSSLAWHPLPVEREYIEQKAEELMEEYGCSKEYGWTFFRFNYEWESEPAADLHEIRVILRAEEHTVTAAHLITEGSAEGVQVSFCCPGTDERFTLTVESCMPAELTEEELSGLREDMELPGHYRVLSYTIAPIPAEGRISVWDCGESDQPRPLGDQSVRQDGPSAVFIASSSSVSLIYNEKKEKGAAGRQTSCSSLHFEPRDKVKWRVVVRVKDRNDMEIRL